MRHSTGAGFGDEIVPSDYVIPGMTMWIPPIMLDSYRHFAINPLVPMKSQRDLEQEALLREAESKPVDTSIDVNQIELDRSGTASRGGAMSEYMMMDDDMGMGGEGGEMYEDAGGMMGMGGAASGIAGKPAEENPVDYKLLRFYDFHYMMGAKRDPDAPQFGRTYVYRIRYGVNDPNFPSDEKLQPKGKTLAPPVYERFTTLAQLATKEGKRTSTRWSEWSSPSPPTRLASPDQAAFGSVKAEKSRRATVGGRSIVIESASPHAEVVAASFDPRYGVFVPTLIDATEGTVLSKEVESADVVDPITYEVKKLENPTIRSGSTIIDIEGGTKLEIVDEDTMVEPGLFLMMDSNGELQVRDAVEEQRLYRIKSFAKERGR